MCTKGTSTPSFNRSNGTITIKGVRLKVTEVFDTFWYFAAERKAIDDRRRAGESPPWTDDLILLRHRFCNPFRVADRVSQYIITEVIEKGSQEPTEVVFRVVLFNLFTKIETYEELQNGMRKLSWASYNRQAYVQILRRQKDVKGITLYTGKFQKPAPNLGHDNAFLNHLEFLEILMRGDFTGQLQKFKYMADAFDYIASFPGMGDFLAYQLLLNLSYTSVINFSESDFVVAGCGARSGLKKCFGLADFSIAEDVMRWMQETQAEHFARLGIAFTGLGPDNLPLQLCDIEHTLCEVDKYARRGHPSIQGTHARKEVGPKFDFATAPCLEQLILPKAWSHPARQIIRVRPPGAPKVPKRYVVDKIVQERGKGKNLEYLIYWWGWPVSAATWEPAAAVLEDAAASVEDYLKAKKSRVVS